MQPSDYPQFRELLQNVCSFYRQDCSPFVLDVWWTALRPYDLEAVSDAIGRHCCHPDTGQYAPKPADIVRLIEGSTLDAAIAAWNKVERAVRHVGTYRTVVFDDPLIHRVIADMGGWIAMGTKSEDEWPFVAKEFQTRYRSYRGQRKPGPHLAKLCGLHDRTNLALGHPETTPVLVGDAAAAQRVLESGSLAATLPIAALVPKNDRIQAENMPPEIARKPQDALEQIIQ